MEDKKLEKLEKKEAQNKIKEEEKRLQDEIKEELEIEKKERKQLKKKIKEAKKEIKIAKKNKDNIDVTLVIELKENEEKFKINEELRKKAIIRKKNNPPRLTLLEEIGNAVSHGIGSILTILAFILLLQKSTTPKMVLASVVYSIAMFFMFTNSCLYHSWKWGSTVKRIWRRFDYTSIYLMIAGTFAPLQLIMLERVYPSFGSTLGLIYFIVMWSLVAIGITFTAIFGPGRIRKLNFTLYFLVGWSGLILVPGFFKYGHNLLWWILGGGIVYTLGMIPFGLLRGKKGAHFVWHIVVLLGVIAHFLGIYFAIYCN